MNSGIYIIRNNKNGKIYIGQSVDLSGRINCHKRLLSQGKHPNSYMQRSYDNAEGDFSFEIMEYCPEEELDEREIFWISYYQSDKREHGYNIQSGGHLGHHWNKEARDRRSGAGNPMYGRKMSHENVERMRIRNRANSDKLTVSDVEDIKRALFDESFSMKELSEIYDVDFTTISKIKNCINWYWVLPELNNKLMTSREQNRAYIRAEIIRMHSEGKTGNEIYSVLPCGRGFVSQVISEEFSDEKIKAESEKTALIKNIRNDVENGLSDNEIRKKYHIGCSTIEKYAGDIKEEKRRVREQERQALAEKIWCMRASGMMVKDIAEALGIHRCTVTEYCKKIHGNTEGS